MKGLVVDADWDPRPGYVPTADEVQRRRAVLSSHVWRHPVATIGQMPEPKITAPNQVLVRNRACGFCGSDIHITHPIEDGYVNWPYRARLPVAIGHEFAGEVVEVGSAVTRLRVGEPVAVEAMRYCGTCRACRRGLPNNCERGEDLGFTFDGGTAQYVVVEEEHCWSLGALTPRLEGQALFDTGAVIEPTAIAYNAMFNRARGFRLGDKVAVFGCGPVGLAAVALARAAGAGKIIATDPVPARRALALEVGADIALDPTSPDIGNRLLEETDGRTVGMAVEASGVGHVVMPQLQSVLGAGGKIVLVGATPGMVPIDTLDLILQGGEIYGSLGHLGGAFGAAIDLHAQGRIDMTKMITGRFDLDDALLALEEAAGEPAGKVVIYPHPW